MRDMKLFLVGLLTLVSFADNVVAADVTAFQVGKIITMDDDDRVINNAVVVVVDGKISALGRSRDIEIPDGAAVIDRPQLWLAPALTFTITSTCPILACEPWSRWSLMESRWNAPGPEGSPPC